MVQVGVQIGDKLARFQVPLGTDGEQGIESEALLAEDAMEEAFPLVPASATVGAVAPLLQACQGILTV
jgi:predicted transcriptional regulator